VRLVYRWLCDFVAVPGDPETIAREIGLRGFEVAGVEHGSQPVIDFEITANRPDCLSHIGLAREASAIWGLPLQMPEMIELPGSGVRDQGSAIHDARSGIRDSGLEVHIEASDLCPRYCAQLFEVQIGPSPQWLQDRLQAAGVRPISNIVDVTNYVMLELGQPMHAFDVERLAGRRLVIRRARPGEQLQTLDDVTRPLDPETLVIADAERPSAIGGVMGGRDSEIGATTRTIALESAYFQPASIRRTSKRLALKTEASTRFERGADVNAPPLGIARAAALFAQIGAGQLIGTLIDCYPSPRRPSEIFLRQARIARVLGQAVPDADVPRILEPLGFEVKRSSAIDAGWTITVPTFRVDVAREVDLIEEVGRHHGFERLPVTFPALTAPQVPPDERIARDRLIRHVLTASGFSESLTFAFIERGAAQPFADAGTMPAAIANPLSEKFAVLRPSLLAGLVDSCAHNRRRGRKDVRLFETGSRFTSTGEGRAAALAWSGAADGAHWSIASRAVDFFDVKGVIETVLEAFGVTAAEFVPVDVPYLVRGRAAEGRMNGATLAVVGQLAPEVAGARGFPESEELYVAEIDTERLGPANIGDALRAASLPRFPSIVRDVSVLVDEALPAAAVRGTIRAVAPPTLASIVEFDRYQGKGIPEGRVSLSLRLTFQDPERTLTDDEAQAATERIVDALGERHGAERR
jgi:phenylalanyl-tRNA synthetase beta chain